MAAISETYEWLRSFDRDDHRKAAVDALDDLGRLNKRARSLLLPVLTEAVLMARRNDSRKVERTAPVRAVYSGESTIDQRRERLESTFAVGDGRRVSWAEATIADHEARIAYLQEHIAGINQTIGEHEYAIEFIREHGVTCLGEIESAA